MRVKPTGIIIEVLARILGGIKRREDSPRKENALGGKTSFLSRKGQWQSKIPFGTLRTSLGGDVGPGSGGSVDVVLAVDVTVDTAVEVVAEVAVTVTVISLSPPPPP